MGMDNITNLENVHQDINEPITTKKCTICDIEKNLDSFCILKSGKYGKHSQCRQCRSQKRKMVRYERPEEEMLVDCGKCNRKLSSNCFNSDHTTSNGLQTYCKDCRRIMNDGLTCTFDGYIKKLYRDLIKNAKRRQIDVKITYDDIINLYHKQRGRCGLTDIDMTHEYIIGESRNHTLTNISVDRIDSTDNYNIDNIQLVCYAINQMKHNLSVDDMYLYCSDIVNNLNLPVLRQSQYPVTQ